MTHIIPITLQGVNLGARHRYLNSLVSDAYNADDPIEDVLKLPESSHIDRLFKIDLASKQKHLQFILQNLQDDDMLFVSRALKSKWILHEEYSKVINPSHLEDVLFPYMITTAVNKMKHWINLNLRDPVRCHEFYEYYIDKDSDYAFKFLSKCSQEIILNEFVKAKTIEKITPQRLKVLCEQTPVVAKIFFELISKDKSLLMKHKQKEDKYFDCIKCILKTDPDTFLDIREQYRTYKELSTISTKYVMTHQKHRFMQKPELYTSQILNVSTIAKCLSPNDCEELVVKLARAQYLGNWFTYKNVEQLVKRLDVTKRASFKKKVFVNKDVGELVMEWPYDIPKFIQEFFDHNDSDNTIKSIFLDDRESDTRYDHIGVPPQMKLCCGRGGRFFRNRTVHKGETLLDALFDEFRFLSFEKTLFELRKKIKSESVSQNRMYMLLVLVSKSGGKPENLRSLFSLLLEHKNEPSQVRAAVIRSLVKRVSIWRVSDDIWNSLLIFSQGLGLDGNIPEAECSEGLHAVVIRNLLSNNECEPAITAAFFNNFSTFISYSLTSIEKEYIKETLLNMLIRSANSGDTKVLAKSLEYAIETLQAYKVNFSRRPELLVTIQKLIKNDTVAAKFLLERLFRAKLGRKELYQENFDVIQTDQSYINSLKHDPTIMSVDKFLKSLVSGELKAEQFLKKINVYFMGSQDLAGRFLIAIKEAKVHKNIARPICHLIGDGIKAYMFDLDRKDEEHKRFSALVRSNAHVARPALDINAIEWKKAGVKLIANKVIISKTVELNSNIKKLLTWNKTARLAIILGQRTCDEADVFATAAKKRPTATLKSALLYFRRKKDVSNFQIWDIIRPLFVRLENAIKVNPHLLTNIMDVNSIPLSIRPKYLVEAFTVITKIDYNKSIGLLCRIKNTILEVDENFIKNVLIDFIQNRFVLDKIPEGDGFYPFQYHLVVNLHLNILVKYVLFSKSEVIQNEKFNSVASLYLDRMRSFWQSTKNKIFFDYVNGIIFALRNHNVFLNTEFVSCLPVMEKIVQWMRGIIPVEENFIIYVPLHLNMLYFKAIREVVQQNPGLLHDRQRLNEACLFVGETFGNYMVQEVRMLIKTYFDSIVILYSIGVSCFFTTFDSSWVELAPYIIKGIINGSSGIECTVALHLYNDVINNGHHSMQKHFKKAEINNIFMEKDLLEMKFFYQYFKVPLNHSNYMGYRLLYM